MRLIAALADRMLLLVLDNCEQVVADAARLAARLLGACPRLRILATSREPLGLVGEALYPISGLTQPPADVELADALRYPAMRLFADRAADVSPGFTRGRPESRPGAADRTYPGRPAAGDRAPPGFAPGGPVRLRLDRRAPIARPAG